MMEKKDSASRLLIKVFAIVIALIGLQMSWISQIYSRNQEVIVKTDRREYKQGEAVRITLSNGLSESIFSHIGSNTPAFSIDCIERKNSAENWDKLFAQCQYPHCIWDIDGPVEIKPNQSESFEWNPLIYIDGTNKYIQAKSGIYRLLTLYQIRKDTSSENWKWLKVYSNEFAIK